MGVVRVVVATAAAAAAAAREYLITTTMLLHNQKVIGCSYRLWLIPLIDLRLISSPSGNLFPDTSYQNNISPRQCMALQPTQYIGCS